MKSYSAPQLVAKGNVIEQTQGFSVGQDDANGKQQLAAPGSVGFGL